MTLECPQVCTLQTCPLSCAQVTYKPSLAGNALYIAIFCLLLIVHVILGIKYKTWGFLVGMILGLVLEVIGYGGRIILHNNPFKFGAFLLYLIPLTVGPACICGSIYLCLSRLVVAYGQNIARFSPRVYAIVFMSSDFISLALQAIGGAISSTANTISQSNMGRYIMIAGLSYQVLSLAVYILVGVDFIRRTRTGGERNIAFDSIRAKSKFKWFQYALWFSTILIFIRSIYRVVELQGGYRGTIAGIQVAFMILEGPLIILATLALAIFHPGYAFDGQWNAARWSLRKSKAALLDIKESESP